MLPTSMQLVDTNIDNNNQQKNQLQFCGYTVLKNTLAKKHTATTTAFATVIENTTPEEKVSLSKKHFCKIKIINDANNDIARLDETIKDSFVQSTGYDLGLTITPEKLQSAWENIDYIASTSSSPSWQSTILCGAGAAMISSLFSSNKSAFSVNLLNNIINYVGFAGLIKVSYNFIRDITGSKPQLWYLLRIKTAWEKCVFNTIKEKTSGDTATSSDCSWIEKSFINNTDFPIIFDNLYRFFGLSNSQLLALFNATLVGIVDTWMDTICNKQIVTDGEYEQFDKATINKKIIENTLFALELNRIKFQDKSIIKENEKNMFVATVIASSSLDRQETHQKQENEELLFNKFIGTLKNDLSQLTTGFYTIGISNFLVLSVTENPEAKVFCLFMPLLDLSYHTSSLDEIHNIILKLNEYKIISKTEEYKKIDIYKIGGGL